MSRLGEDHVKSQFISANSKLDVAGGLENPHQYSLQDLQPAEIDIDP